MLGGAVAIDAGGARIATNDVSHDHPLPVTRAIQSADGDRAVAAMDTVRSLMERYRV